MFPFNISDFHALNLDLYFVRRLIPTLQALIQNRRIETAVLAIVALWADNDRVRCFNFNWL